MDQISTALTIVLAVSVSVERITEILKQMFPFLNRELSEPTKEGHRRALLQLLAAVLGGLIAWAGDLRLGSHTGWIAWVLIGLMSSGGSAFWNHALDAVRAMKIDRESTASERQALSRQLVASVEAKR